MHELLQGVRTVVLVDWPSREVPDSLARAGFEVFVKGGPNAGDFSLYEVNGHQVIARRVGRPTHSAQLVYSYRPLAELPEIIALAKAIGAKTIWLQSGRSSTGNNDPRGCWLPAEEQQSARQLLEATGMNCVTEPYIVDALHH